MQRAFVLVALAACGTPVVRHLHRTHASLGAVAIAHFGELHAVAITDEGDAALTANTSGGLVLWPALRGKREPIALAFAVPARQIAIGHGRQGYVAAVIDTAGGVELLAVADDGTIGEHAQLPIDPPATQVLACRGDVLVVRADQSITRVDAGGRVLGRIASDPGTQLAAVAMRRGRAAAVLVESPVLRWIDLDRGLAWGKTVTLPLALAGPLALAPGGSRLAGFGVDSATVIDLQPAPHVVGCRIVPAGPGGELGFLDDDDLVAPSGSHERLSRVGVCGERSLELAGRRLAVGDGVAIDLERTGLEVLTLDEVEHLTWPRRAPWP